MAKIDQVDKSFTSSLGFKAKADNDSMRYVDACIKVMKPSRTNATMLFRDETNETHALSREEFKVLRREMQRAYTKAYESALGVSSNSSKGAEIMLYD